MIPAPALRLLHPLRRAYVLLARPRTFGVKTLIRHSDGRFLVVRHSYGDRERWGLPGGGYRPDREAAADAAAREVWEELRMRTVDFRELDTVEVTGKGRRDALTLFAAVAADGAFQCSPELAEARWVTGIGELGDAPLSRWLLLALERDPRRP